MKSKHTAKVIGKTGSGQPIRTYRGHLIVKRSNAYLCDAEITGSEYRIYDKDQSPENHTAIEIVSTLADAKSYIDRINS
jgi:hypothetical protein